MKKSKRIPKFKNEKEEREFWQNQDSTDFINWKEAKQSTFANLKPSTKTISLRLPESLLNDLKVVANKNDVPYQSLIKIILQKQVEREMRNSLN